MIVGRAFGILFLLLAAGVLGHELLAVAEGADTGWRMRALGELWYVIHAPSLNGVQAGIQRNIAPWLWEDAIARLLVLPAWPSFAVLGAVLVVLFRRRRRRNRHA